MRSLIAAVLYLSACGGSAPPPQAPVATAPAPVTDAEPAPAGDQAREPGFADEPLPPVTPQPPAKGCDPKPFIDAAGDKIAKRQDASALAEIEKALVCEHDPKVERFAVLFACRAKLYARARAHFIRLDEADKPKLAEACTRPDRGR